MLERREFVAGSVGACAMLALGTLSLAPRAHAIHPPSAQDEAQFIGACIRCEKCMEACPAGAIVPSHIENGLITMRLPKLNFSQSVTSLGGKSGWCDHCELSNGGVARCAEVCPSGALDVSRTPSFEDMRLGVAEVDRETCIAWNLKTCSLCMQACPLEAIMQDEHGRPHVDVGVCNGCGACEQACVSLESTSVGQGDTSRAVSERAIVVKSQAE